MSDRKRGSSSTESAVPKGPRGGTTTITRSGWVKKNLWLPAELAEGLRMEAFRLRVSEAALMRRGLEKLLGERAATRASTVT